MDIKLSDITVGTIVTTFDNVAYVIEGKSELLFYASRLTKDFKVDSRYKRGSAGLSKGCITRVIVPVNFKDAV